MAKTDPTNEGLRVDLNAMIQRGDRTHDIELVLEKPWLRAVLSKTDADVSRDGAVKLDVSIQGDGMALVRGDVTASFAVPCGRCLAPAPVVADGEVLVTFLPDTHEHASRARRADEALDANEDGEALREDDLGVYLYRGHTLDLSPMLAEQIALAYPMRILCSRGEDCRGLCTNCGHNLNELAGSAQACTCGMALWEVSHAPADRAKAPENAGDSPWKAALRKLQDN